MSDPFGQFKVEKCLSANPAMSHCQIYIISYSCRAAFVVWPMLWESSWNVWPKAVICEFCVAIFSVCMLPRFISGKSRFLTWGRWFFSSSKPPDRLWVSHRLLINLYLGLFLSAVKRQGRKTYHRHPLSVYGAQGQIAVSRRMRKRFKLMTGHKYVTYGDSWRRIKCSNCTEINARRQEQTA